MGHAIEQALESPLPLKKTLEQWNEIERDLREPPRKRAAAINIH